MPPVKPPTSSIVHPIARSCKRIFSLPYSMHSDPYNIATPALSTERSHTKEPTSSSCPSVGHHQGCVRIYRGPPQRQDSQAHLNGLEVCLTSCTPCHGVLWLPYLLIYHRWIGTSLAESSFHCWGMKNCVKPGVHLNKGPSVNPEWVRKKGEWRGRKERGGEERRKREVMNKCERKARLCQPHKLLSRFPER